MSADEGAEHGALIVAIDRHHDALAEDALIATVAAVLLESDAMTANEEGTPTHYYVDAENVEYLVGIVLSAADAILGGVA